MLKLFTVYDVKVGAYLPPMTMRSAGEALRSFGAACNSKEHDFFKYAEDYTLFELGEWDEINANIKMHHVPIPLSKAIEASSYHSENYFSVKLDKEKVA